MNYDVIVIGAGLSGFMAAEAAQNEGARVLLLAKGMGSLPLTTGCIDGLGYIPGNLKIAMPSLQSSLPELARNHPQHPYLKVGRDGILASLSHFQGLCRGRGLPYAGDSSSAFFLPTALGTFHPTCLVPETMRRGDLSLPGPALLLGFQGLRDFSPSLAAENLNLLHSRGRILSSFRAEVLGGLNLRGKPMNGLNLAWAFDEKDFRDVFLRRVGPLLKKGERLGLPAVLGFHSSSETWKDVQAGLDTEIFEVPLPPPSVPGLRLYNCLRDHLREKGVRIFLGLSELTPICEPFRLNGFSIGPSSQKVVYRARAFVLATGKFFGGGLDSDRGRIYETLLGLPLKYPPHRREWFNPRFLAPEGHPFNSFGVEVDDHLRPVDGEGKVLYQNLFAAGGILAHADSMAEKSGGGVAVSTGYLAGKLAAAMR